MLLPTESHFPFHLLCHSMLGYILPFEQSPFVFNWLLTADGLQITTLSFSNRPPKKAT